MAEEQSAQQQAPVFCISKFVVCFWRRSHCEDCILNKEISVEHLCVFTGYSVVIRHVTFV